MKPKTIVSKDILDQILREKAELEARLAKLSEAERIFREMEPNSPKVRAEIPRQLQTEAGRRAPYGALQAAILELFKTGSQKLSNADIRAALERNGYPYTLDNVVLRKTLTRMAGQGGNLTSNHESGRVWFSLPKSAAQKARS